MKLLLVEDNTQLNKALSTLLKRNSYVVDSAFDGEEALLFIEKYTYDVIILDIMIPRLNGLEVLKRMREAHNNTPVIMLTAKSTVDDKIKGLDYGADDYLTKPFNSDELLARIRALGRRKGEINDKKALNYGDFTLNLDNLSLSKDNESVTLTNKEVQILSLLINSEGKVISLDDITNKAWDIEAYSTSENVWVFISYLRKKLESIHSDVKIKSIRYQGYYLEYKA